jgi:hypothetical protein
MKAEENSDKGVCRYSLRHWQISRLLPYCNGLKQTFPCGRQYCDNVKMSVPKRLEILTIIKFCVSIGKTPPDTYKELKRASGTSSVSRRLVFNDTTVCRGTRVSRRWQPIRQTSVRNAGACDEDFPIYLCTGGICYMKVA